MCFFAASIIALPVIFKQIRPRQVKHLPKMDALGTCDP